VRLSLRVVQGQDQEVDPYLSELIGRLEGLIGDRLVSAWLVGSGALGDFDPRRSDIDVQAVCSARVSPDELERLAVELSHEVLPCPALGLEFVLYARDDLDDPRGPAFSLNLNTGRSIDHHVGYDPDAEPRFWFVLDIAIARQRARRLAGAQPAQILPHLPDVLVRAALRDALARYRECGGAEAVFAACRAWAWAGDQQWRSKGAASAWAIARSPDHARLITTALAQRAGAPGHGITQSETAAFVSAIDRLLTA
jgi:aminoglycoside adenylyltransferase-like protein